MIKKTLLTFFLMGFIALPVLSECFDHSTWNNILSENVDENGLVNYQGVKINKGGNLYEYLTYLEIANLSNCTQDEKLAFWVNAYNANVFRFVTSKSDIASVKEIEPMFSKRIYMANQKVSLNTILDRILRSDSKKGGPIKGVSIKKLDPRIHFVLVKGAVGYPKLARKALTSKNIEAQLHEAALKFAYDPRNFQVKSDILILSGVLKWYGEDFDVFGGVVNYFAKIMDPKKRKDAPQILEKLKSDYPDKAFYEFDWSLNQIPPER